MVNANLLESFTLEFSSKFIDAILDTESHAQRLHSLLFTNREHARMVEAEVMRSNYDSMCNIPEESLQ